MKLSNKAIKDFKDIYYKEYGIVLDNEKAKKIATKFFNMMRVFHKTNET